MAGASGPLRWLGRNAKKAVVFVVGLAILLAGVAMLALPGPGVLVIIVGLLVLSTEFAWAERLLDRTVERAAGVATNVIDDKRGRIALGLSGVAMVVGGIVGGILFSQWLVVGISIAVAGAISLSTLHPAVGRWVEERARYGINQTDDVVQPDRQH
ncbi:MAG: PGPGW domain-containing protein [Actinomycetota bacterium]